MMKGVLWSNKVICNYRRVGANISKLSVGYEFGTTVQTADGITMTEYTSVSISGPQALAATCAWFMSAAICPTIRRPMPFV